MLNMEYSAQNRLLLESENFLVATWKFTCLRIKIISLGNIFKISWDDDPSITGLSDIFRIFWVAFMKCF